MSLSNVPPRQQLASAATAVRLLRDTAVNGTAAAAPSLLGRQTFGRALRVDEAPLIDPGTPEALLLPDGLCGSPGSPSGRRRYLGRQLDRKLPDFGQEQPGTTGDSIAVRWTAVSMADLERPPSTRPVVAGPSLRSVRTVDNLQRLLEGRPAGMPPLGLLRTQALPVSPSERRMNGERSALSESDAPAEAAQATPDGASNGVPVFVMLPLDSVTSTGKFRYANSKWFARALASLVCTGVRGVAIDVWWGAVEREPRQYDWSGYRALFEAAKRVGLKVQAVMSFHACGGNVGDSTQVPLPAWVLQAEEEDPDLFFRDRPRSAMPGGNVNREYISLFSDDVPSLGGRTPLGCYADYMAAFAEEFALDLGSAIEEVVVGSGPCGELRYPSYLEANGWRFPGVGEFQCYDRRALASLAAAAEAAGHPEWGNGGPSDAGGYNSTPEEAPFFRSWGGSWDTEYGRFFLGWYSGELLAHGERLMAAAAAIFKRNWPVQPQPTGPTDEANAAAGLPGSTAGGSSNMLSNMSTTTAVSTGSRKNARQGLPRPSSAPVGMWRQGGGDGSSAASTTPRPSPPAPSSTMGATQSGAGSPWGSIGGASSTSLLSDSTDMQAAMQQDGAGPESQQQQGSPEDTGQQQQQCSQQQLQAAQQSSQQQQQATSGSQQQGQHVPQQLQPVPEAAASASVDNAQRRQAHVPGQVHVTLKVAGLHWWWHTRSHAAEATAGYWNCAGRDGYRPLVAACAKHDLALTLTCVEMCDAQHPPAALCGPEGLLRKVRELAAAEGVVLGGENALPCFSPNGVDATALERIVYNTQAWAPPLEENARRNSTSRNKPLLPVSTPVSSAAPAASSRDEPGARPAADPSQPLSTAAAAVVAAASVQQEAEAATSGNNDGQARVGVQQQQTQQTPLPPQGPASPWPIQAPTSSWPGQPSQLRALPIMRAFTFLRLSPEMTSPAYQGTWLRFMAKMQNNAKRPAPMPEPHLGLRPVAAPRTSPGSAASASWVPPPPPPQRPSSSEDA